MCPLGGVPKLLSSFHLVRVKLPLFSVLFTRRACATAYSDRSNLLCFFRILITSKNIVLREYFGWNYSNFGRDLYRND